MKTDDKIKLANDLCDKKNDFKYNYIYPFSTENIDAYIDSFDLANKSLLTVGSSGDQVFNAILNDCKDITVLDICPFTKEYIYLKAAAMQFMSRREFINFFCYKKYGLNLFNNKNAFMDANFFVSLNYLDDMDNEVSHFWHSLFREYSGSQIRKNLFMNDEFSYKALVKTNPYLRSDDNFSKLRNKIKRIYDINFINGDIFKYNMTKKYDNINLSNIGACYKYDKFMQLIMKMDNILNDDGTMLIAYLFDTDITYEDGHKRVYNLKSLLADLPEGTIIKSFIGSNGVEAKFKEFQDSAIIYKKIKKR